MQSAECPKAVLQPILDRIHLDSLGSIEYYQRFAKDLGWKEVGVMDLSKNLPVHYARVLQELVVYQHTLVRVCAEDYLAKMKVGLQHWVDAGIAGHLTWGILHFQKD
jgi:sarcosine/dimethylglycine N-methyltransferase